MLLLYIIIQSSEIGWIEVHLLSDASTEIIEIAKIKLKKIRYFFIIISPLNIFKVSKINSKHSCYNYKEIKDNEGFYKH